MVGGGGCSAPAAKEGPLLRLLFLLHHLRLLIQPAVRLLLQFLFPHLCLILFLLLFQRLLPELLLFVHVLPLLLLAVASPSYA